MVFYEITIFPLEDKILVEEPGILTPFYADNAIFIGLARGAHSS